MKRLLTFLKPYRLPIVIVMTLVFLQTLADLFLPTLLALIVDQGVVHGDIPYILRIGGIMLLVAACGVGFSIASSFFSARIATGFSRDLRSHLFTHVEYLALPEFEQIGTASLITRTTNDINQLQQVLTMLLRMMLMAPMMCIGGIVMAVSMDGQLALILIAAIPILTLIIFVIARKGIPLFKTMQKKLDQLNLILRELLTGIRVIRSFNRHDYEKERFDQANSALTATAIRVNRLMAAMMPFMMLVLNFSTIAILWFGGIRIEQGAMQVGALMAFLQYAMLILFSFIMLSLMFVMIPRASVSAARINEVLQLKREAGGELNQHPTRTSEGIVATNREGDPHRQGEERRGLLEFQAVSFRYPGAEQPALHPLSFTAKPGEVTAIIGGTGAGKSTLLGLIPRFYEPEAGRILLDGVDIEQIPLETLRAQIGYVPQKALLFSGTIAENIRLGHEEATLDEVKHAATIAQAAGFIDSLQESYQTLITQGGRNLSGGQKQRLAIARALIKQPAIYLFDDSFSALDYKTDAKLRAALTEETKDATVLIVAQRISTIMDADQIIVLDEGKMVGSGTHQELLTNCEVYQEIVASQLGEERSA